MKSSTVTSTEEKTALISTHTETEGHPAFNSFMQSDKSLLDEPQGTFSMAKLPDLSTESIAQLREKLVADKMLILVGDAGAGKSALACGLARKPIFNTGMSNLHGLTTNVEISPPIAELDGYQIVDSPGLGDHDNNVTKRGLNQLEVVMGQEKKFLLLFVLRTNGCRLQVNHILMIKQFMHSFSPLKVPFGVVVNHMSDSELKQWKNQKLEEKLIQLLQEEGVEPPNNGILTLPIFPGIEKDDVEKQE